MLSNFFGARHQGKSDPQLGPDDAYPDWLWTLTAPKPLEAELQGKLDAAGYTGKPGPTPQELPITIDEVCDRHASLAHCVGLTSCVFFCNRGNVCCICSASAPSRLPMDAAARRRKRGPRWHSPPPHLGLEQILVIKI